MDLSYFSWKVALAAVVGAVQGAMGKIGECLAGVVENQKGNVESQTNSNKSGEKSLLDSNNISDPLNLYSNKPWRNVDSNIKLPDNECYIGPANENALLIVSDELTMTEYDPYMKDFKDGMYVQNRAPDNRYYLGTITYNSDLNMAIYKPTDKKGFEQAKLEQDKKDIRTIASFAADWTPVDVAIDSASFIAGHDIITGEECNRGILAAGILLPGGLDSLGKGLAKKGVKQAAKHGDDVAEEAFKIGDDVYDATKGVSKTVFTTTEDAANVLGKELNGTVSQLKNGYKVEIPNGNKPIVVRVMNEGSGGRANPYYRVSIDGKGSLTLDGTLSSDRGLTHIDMTDDYLSQIENTINKYLGK
ncbi:hypothetical protein ACTQ31_06395 [Clostridium butyricum]|uniref:hypothetical protein n=1 Tax=Clostridium butyricum TaxID=1492 RepID=UPI003F8FCC0B